MKHIFKQGKENAPVFLLLHGTGADETDLLPLASMLNEDYSVLSVRGNVSENGMNRYFKRHGMGQYDMEDLEFRSKELFDFVKEQADEHGFKTEDVIPLGFSNGSNIAIHMLLREDVDFKQALLFAPLYPVDLTDNNKDMSDVRVFLSMGKNDPMASAEDNEYTQEIFKSRGAEVGVAWVNGHELTQDALVQAKNWLK